MSLNSKHRTEKLKIKNERYKNPKNQNTERRKHSFTKRLRRKCRIKYNFVALLKLKRHKL